VLYTCFISKLAEKEIVMTPAATDQKTILIVEDDQSIQTMYKMKLGRAGFHILLANNGQQGLDSALAHHPDLILLDLMMPEMDGETMLMKLREDNWGESAKVIVLTNISRDEAPKSMATLGVLQYLVKALYTPSQVQQVVERVLL
jgi:DNA-binding response OmpR family regulator